MANNYCCRDYWLKSEEYYNFPFNLFYLIEKFSKKEKELLLNCIEKNNNFDLLLNSIKKSLKIIDLKPIVIKNIKRDSITLFLFNRRNKLCLGCFC